jgi:hypothetical protein
VVLEDEHQASRELAVRSWRFTRIAEIPPHVGIVTLKKVNYSSIVSPPAPIPRKCARTVGALG